MIYDFSAPECHVIFNTTSRFIKNWIADTEKKQLPFFSVHRDAKLSDEEKRAVADLWERRGLS